jgi:hypothetical protein
MKKSTSLLTLISPDINIQSDQPIITEYFPVDVGNVWTYQDSSHNFADRIFVKNKTKDKDGSMLYLFEHQQVLATTRTLYGIKNNNIVIISTKNSFDVYDEKKPPYPIELAIAGHNWKIIENKNTYRQYITSKSSVKYDDKSYDDCILVEETVFTNDRPVHIKKGYYARNVGLVYIALQGENEIENVFLSLISKNF